jgi:hypothetical protein
MSNANVRILIAKYNRPKEKFTGGKAKFDPNIKWVEYTLDLLEARRLLQDVDFVTKFDVEKVIRKIENKIDWHENQVSFSMKKATEDLRTARRLLRL